MYTAFRASVIETRRISPSFQRIRLAGLHGLVARLDVRLKLIIPGDAGLPDFPDPADWWATFSALDPATRGHLRTYSVRTFNPDTGELDIDFVLHTKPGQTGPASEWAASASEGDEIWVCGPTEDDGVGIEFAPGAAQEAHLFGDETALPAIANILREWPGIPGTIHIEVPYAQDQQILPAPNGVTVRFYPRGDLRPGTLLADAAATLTGSTVPEFEVAGEVWETPTFSASGESLESAAADAYYWIAGEASFVTAMRRMLVREAEVPRASVSFMGYWRA